jgi:hypothetical protein
MRVRQVTPPRLDLSNLYGVRSGLPIYVMKYQATERGIMLFPLVIIAGLITLAIVLAGISKRNPKVLLLSTALLWLMAIASAVPVLWAWNERVYSENWALYGVMFVSAPLILTIFALVTVLLIAAKKKKMPIKKTTIISLSLLGLFLVLQVALLAATAR